MVFYQIETEEVSDRFMAHCFVNGSEAYDGEINLGVEENMISNEYAVSYAWNMKLKEETKWLRKNSLSFLRLTKAITDFGVGTVIIYPDIDPFLEETEEEGKSDDDWVHLLDFNIDDIPLLGEEGLPPFVCKMGKSSRNKKRAMENLNFFYQDIGTSSSAGGHLTQEKEAIAIRMSQKFALLEEEMPIIETMAYHDKYKKILDKVWKDKVELDGKIVKEEEAVKRINGEALKEKDDPGAFIFPIRFKGQFNENALADTRLDINTMPFRIYVQLGRDDMKKTMGTHDDEARSSRSKRPRQHETVEEVLLPQINHEFLLWEGCNRDAKSSLTLLEFARRLGLYHADELEEDSFNVYFEGGLRSDKHFNAQDYWLSISQEENLGLSRSHTSTIENPILRVIHKMITYGLWQRTTRYDKVQKNDLCLLCMFDARHQNGYANVAWGVDRGCGKDLSAPIYCRDLDTITLRDLINLDGKLIREDLQPGVPRVGIPRPSKASMQDLYDKIGRMEIRQEGIKRMEYRQSYQWDRYQGCLSIWLGFTVFQCREPTTHLGMLSGSMTSIISSTRHRYHNISSSSRMMMSSVETTRVGYVTACFGSLMF
ncbi:hypothetical protein Tco_1530162 [Tanacetum coccineum]